jgi:uncharacterized Tic20 family protein
MSDPTPQGSSEDRPSGQRDESPPPPPAAPQPPPVYGGTPDPGPPPPPPGQPAWNGPPGPQGTPAGPPPQGWAGPPPGPYGAGPQYGVRPATDAEARSTAALAHYLGLAVLVGFGWLGPLIIWLTKKDSHPFINDQAREALNFNISMTIYLIVSSFLAMFLFFLIIPVLLPFAVVVANVIFAIIAGSKASAGEAYRYPLTLRLVT